MMELLGKPKVKPSGCVLGASTHLKLGRTSSTSDVHNRQQPTLDFLPTTECSGDYLCCCSLEIHFNYCRDRRENTECASTFLFMDDTVDGCDVTL